jgi:hypothetical protein
MKPEKHFLIDDLLDDYQATARRDATLLAAGRVLRHKRWRRTGARAMALVAVVALAALAIQTRSHRPPPILSSVPVPPATVRHLTDDQLLALFPNTPVGLATVDGRKVLVFPRPADQARFVGKF